MTTDFRVPEGNPEKPQGEAGYALLERMNGGHHEVLANWGLSRLALSRDANMLDCGCGGGANLLRLLEYAPEGHATGVDYSDVSVDLARRTCAEACESGRIDVVKADVAALPFPDETFDVATAFETVYFWPDARAAFIEIKRVLKPGGTFFVCNESDGTTEVDQAMADQIACMELYPPARLESLMREAGYTDVSVDHEASRCYVSVQGRKAEKGTR